MTAATNTFSIEASLCRARTNGTSTTRQLVRAITTMTEVKPARETNLAAGATAVALDLEGKTAVALVIIATQPVKVYINGAVTPFNTGSFVIVFDTNITSVTIDNDVVSTPTATLLEYWWAA